MSAIEIEQSEKKKSYFSKPHTSQEKRKKGKNKWKEVVLFLNLSLISRFLSEHLCMRSNIPGNLHQFGLQLYMLLICSLDSGWPWMIQLNNYKVTPVCGKPQRAVGGGQREGRLLVLLGARPAILTSSVFGMCLMPTVPTIFQEWSSSVFENMTLREPTWPWEIRVLLPPSSMYVTKSR